MWTRPMRRPDRRTSSRSRVVKSTNSVAFAVSKRRRLAIIAPPRAHAAGAGGAAGSRFRTPRLMTRLQWRERKRPESPGSPRWREAVRSAPGTGRPSAMAPPERRARRGLGAGFRPPPAPPQGRAWAASWSHSRPQPRDRTDRSRTVRPPTVPPSARARVRAALGGSRDGLHQRACQLSECRKRSEAGLVVARHHVIEAKTENCVEHQGHQHLTGNGQPDTAVFFQAVQLLLDHLAVASEQLRQVRLEAFRAGCLHEQVEGRQLDVTQAAQGVPDRLHADLEHLQGISELVESAPQLLHRAGCQVPPGLDQQLRLGWEPVLEVADRHPGARGDGPDTRPRVAVFQERLGGGVDDLISGALGRGHPSHTYVLFYSGGDYVTACGIIAPGRAEHRTSVSKRSLWRAPDPALGCRLPGLPGRDRGRRPDDRGHDQRALLF